MLFLCTLREFPSSFRSWGFTRGEQSRQVLRSLLKLPGEVTLSLPAALLGVFVLLLGTCSNQTLPSPLLAANRTHLDPGHQQSSAMDTDLRTPDGKRPPHVSTHPLLHKKKKTPKKNHQGLSVCPFLPPSLPHARGRALSSWGWPSLAQRGQPDSVGSPHAWLAPEALCKRAVRSLGGREEEGGAVGLQFALMMQ